MPLFSAVSMDDLEAPGNVARIPIELPSVGALEGQAGFPIAMPVDS
jgi:hypothetical protein